MAKTIDLKGINTVGELYEKLDYYELKRLIKEFLPKSKKVKTIIRSGVNTIEGQDGEPFEYLQAKFIHVVYGDAEAVSIGRFSFNSETLELELHLKNYVTLEWEKQTRG